MSLLLHSCIRHNENNKRRNGGWWGREFQGDEGSEFLGGRISPQGTVLLLRIGKQHITILKREGERKIERGVGEKFP